MVSVQRYVDYERVASLYRRGRTPSPEVLDRWADAVRPFCPPGPLHVVDVGAGVGIFAEAWPRWLDARVTAIEPAAAMIKAATPAPRVAFVQGAAEHLPLGGVCADVAWVSTAIHHFADMDLAISELERVLRRGGRVLVRGYVPGRSEITYVDQFPGRQKWVRRFPDEARLVSAFATRGLPLLGAVNVVEHAETFAASADWVEMMRHADSLLTALSDDDIETGLRRLRADPDRMGQVQLTLMVFRKS